MRLMRQKFVVNLFRKLNQEIFCGAVQHFWDINQPKAGNTLSVTGRKLPEISSTLQQVHFELEVNQNCFQELCRFSPALFVRTTALVEVALESWGIEYLGVYKIVIDVNRWYLIN